MAVLMCEIIEYVASLRLKVSPECCVSIAQLFCEMSDQARS